MSSINSILHKFDLAEARVFDAAKKGMALAGLALLADAIQRQPTVPYREGTLRGSGSVAVEGAVTATSRDLGLTKGDPESTGAGSIGRGRNEIVALVGFNMPYAANLHFIKPPGGFSEPSAGTNYLFGKMASYNKLYYGLVAKSIREVL